MKRFKLYILFYFILIMAGLSSCSDNFLDLEPKVNRLEANSYNTEDDAFSAMVAVYNCLATQPWNYVPIQSDIFSDDAYTGGEPGGGMQQWGDQERSIIPAENSAASALWGRCYSGNYRANMYLLKEAGISWKNESKRKRMKAEVLTLRAYFYWDLVRHWGWVPIISEVIPNIQTYKSIPQSAPEEVYNFIIKDLLTAIPDLPESTEITSSEKGRITKDVARMLIARIYLYYEGFVKPVLGATGNLTYGSTVIDKAYVKNTIDEIISSNRYHLLANYADVFDWGNENNAESIFEWQYADGAHSNDWGGWGIAGNFSVVFYGPRSPKGDPTVAPGWSFATVSWSLVNEYEAGDPRKDVSIYDANTKLTSYLHSFQNTGYFNHKYMGNALYTPSSGGTLDHNWGKNYIDIRYAEALLIGAELYLNDDNGKALNYFNQVRTRAMGIAAAKSSLTLDDIYHELRVEFAGEGHRKWDLLRRGLDYAKTEINASWVIPAGADSPNDFIGREFKTDTWGMLPIPAGEIILADPGVLVQHVPAFQ